MWVDWGTWLLFIRRQIFLTSVDLVNFGILHVFSSGIFLALMSNELPVWQPWVNKKVNGKESKWKVAQLSRFLAHVPKAKPKDVLGWLSNTSLHPTNPLLGVDSKGISKLLSKARKRPISSDSPSTEAPARKKRKKETTSTTQVYTSVKSTVNLIKDFSPEARLLFCQALSKKIPELTMTRRQGEYGTSYNDYYSFCRTHSERVEIFAQNAPKLLLDDQTGLQLHYV